MSSLDDSPIFNLRAVVHETGIKSDTLRAWERRYGLPSPERTSGGHRLYSRRDIEILKWLIARQEAGLSISKAVDLWRRLEADGEDHLQTREYATAPQPAASYGLPIGGTLAEMREAWVAACLAFDEQGAEQVLAQSFALFSVEHVCFKVLQAGLAQIGRGWYEGNVAVQQEHFATQLAMRRLEALVTAAPAPARSGRILAACAPQENHTFSLLLLTLLLRRRGWDVLFLGANVPIDRIAETAAAGHVQLVTSVAQQLHTASTLLEMAHVLQQEEISLTYGGWIFNQLPALRDRIPGHFLGEQVQAAPPLVEHIMVTRPPLKPVAPTPETLQQALAHYSQQLSAIEASVRQTLLTNGITHARLSQANQSMGLDISAALSLGDMAYLGNEIEWVKGLLLNHHLPLELLDHYLTAYYHSLQTHLDERGRPILTWLAQLIV